MNGEVEVLKIKAIAFPRKFEAGETVENIVVDETIAAEARKRIAFANKEKCFARLKKHLRKRSASIL